MITNLQLERRARYRLALHGCKLHKLRTNKGYIVIDSDDESDASGVHFQTIMMLMDFIESLAEKDHMCR